MSSPSLRAVIPDTGVRWVGTAVLALTLAAAPAVTASAQDNAQRNTQRNAQNAAPSLPTQPLSLGDAIRFAARNSASAKRAQIGVDAADARVRQSRSALLPQLSASGSDGMNTFNTATLGLEFPTQPGEPPLFPPNGSVPPAFRIVDYRGKIVQSLFDFSTYSRIRSAQALTRSAQADAETAAEYAGTNAAVAYIRALRAEDDLRARNADSVLAADLFQIAKTQLDAGVGIALDVTRAKAQVAAVHAQLIASRNAQGRAKLDLLRALGLPLSSPITLRDSLAALSSDGLSTDPASAVQDALTKRPELRAEQARIAAAQQAITAVKRERLPTIAAFGDKGVNGKNYQYLLNTYHYGFQVSLPLFDGFRREGRIEEQAAQLRDAQIREKDLRDQTEADIRAALLDLGAAREQVDAARERQQLAEQEVSQARDRFKAGVAGNADVITASLSLTASRTALIDALTNYHVARIALARAEGVVTTLP